MKNLSTLTDNIVKSFPRTSVPSEPSSADSVIPLTEDQAGREALATLLLDCYNLLRVYGKTPEALENTVGMFIAVLAAYPYASIYEAFRIWLKRSNEMPTPADIVGLIERDGKPPLDRTVYVNISKKDAELRTSEEWAYMREFERWQMRGDT